MRAILILDFFVRQKIFSDTMHFGLSCRGLLRYLADFCSIASCDITSSNFFQNLKAWLFFNAELRMSVRILNCLIIDSLL